MEIAFTPSAWRSWKKLPAKTRVRLQEKLLLYSKDPLQYAIKLKESKIGDFRFRIGDYRIVFDLQPDRLIVLAVGDRKEIYK